MAHLSLGLQVGIGTLLVAASIQAAAAERIVPRPTTMTAPPRAIYLAERQPNIGKSGVEIAGANAGNGPTSVPPTSTLVLETPGPGGQLVVSADGTRWALSFQQGDGAAPLRVDGKTLSAERGPAALLFGDANGTVIGHTIGNKKCNQQGSACFEVPVYFGPHGRTLFTQELRSRGGSWNQYTVGAAPRMKVFGQQAPQWDSVANKATSIAGDNVILQHFDGSKKPANGMLYRLPANVMSPVVHLGGKLVYFRRDGAEQRVAVVETLDTGAAIWVDANGKTNAGSQFKIIATAAQEFANWRNEFVANPAQHSLLFALDASFESADVFELTATGAVRKISSGIYQIYNASTDGVWLLASRKVAVPGPVKGMTRMELIAIEITTGRIVPYVSGNAIDKFNGAGFIANATP
ncbi:MAG TPA: hypothetical protein PLF40_04760 [Kofleriaceae bacterium]|nr:hypothetical protein [Kofleriaceae bacterium]